MLKQLLHRYQQDIVGFGFIYRPYIHLSILLLMYVFVIAFAYFFKMNYIFMTLTCIIATLLFPTILYLLYEYSSEENEFSEFTSFISHMCGSFKLHPKILNTLLECELVTQGKLKQKIEEVIANLRNGEAQIYM